MVRPLGVNWSFLKEYSPYGKLDRLNLLHSFRGWTIESTGATFLATDDGTPKDLTPLGLPATIPAGKKYVTLGYRDLGTKGVDFGGPVAPYEAGTYVLKWTGPTMDIRVGFNATNFTVINANRIEFDVVTRTDAGIVIGIENNTAGAISLAGVADLRLVLKSEEGLTEAERFQPEINAELSIFTASRRMEDLDINSNEFTVAVPDGYIFWTETGPPVEEICRWHNDNNQDLWFCIPAMMPDAEVDALLLRIEAALDPELAIYLEYANETWNKIPYEDTPTNPGEWITTSTGSVPAREVWLKANDGQPVGGKPGVYTIGPGALDPNPFTAQWMQMGLSAQALFDRAKAVLRANVSRWHFVLGVQYVSVGGGSPVDIAIDNCPDCEFVGGAPYVPTIPTDPNYDVDTQTTAQILAQYIADRATVQTNINAFATFVQGKGKKVIWYEGGPSQMLGSKLNLGLPAEDHSALLAVQQDAQMYDEMTFLLDATEAAAPGSLHFTYGSYVYGGAPGQIAFKRYPGEAAATSPKYTALADWAAGDLTPGTPTQPVFSAAMQAFLIDAATSQQAAREVQPYMAVWQVGDSNAAGVRLDDLQFTTGGKDAIYPGLYKWDGVAIVPTDYTTSLRNSPVGVSASTELAKYMADSGTRATLINSAQPGSGVTGTFAPTGGADYTLAISDFQAAVTAGAQLGAIVINLGVGDLLAAQTPAATAAGVLALIDDLRGVQGTASNIEDRHGPLLDRPVIVIGVPDLLKTNGYQQQNTDPLIAAADFVSLDDAFAQFPLMRKGVAYVSPAGLPLDDESGGTNGLQPNVHYTGAAHRTLGQRCFAALTVARQNVAGDEVALNDVHGLVQFYTGTDVSVSYPPGLLVEQAGGLYRSLGNGSSTSGTFTPAGWTQISGGGATASALIEWDINGGALPNAGNTVPATAAPAIGDRFLAWNSASGTDAQNSLSELGVLISGRVVEPGQELVAITAGASAWADFQKVGASLRKDSFGYGHRLPVLKVSGGAPVPDAVSREQHVGIAVSNPVGYPIAPLTYGLNSWRYINQDASARRVNMIEAMSQYIADDPNDISSESVTLLSQYGTITNSARSEFIVNADVPNTGLPTERRARFVGTVGYGDQSFGQTGFNFGALNVAATSTTVAASLYIDHDGFFTNNSSRGLFVTDNATTKRTELRGYTDMRLYATSTDFGVAGNTSPWMDFDSTDGTIKLWSDNPTVGGAAERIRIETSGDMSWQDHDRGPILVGRASQGGATTGNRWRFYIDESAGAGNEVVGIEAV